jgi:ATP-binding cassette subfamily F protein 3
LVEALNDFPGAVIVVSHDPHLIETTADRLWLVEDGSIQSFDGDIGDYRDRVLGQNDGRDNGDGKSKSGKQARRKNRAAERKYIAPLRNKIHDSEKRVTNLQAQQGLLETELAQPNLYQRQPERVVEINKQLALIKDDIAAEEGAWLRLQSDLEAAEAPLAN